jgi:hypothetical protein
MGYVPAPRVVAVGHVVAGKRAMHSVCPPEAKVTLPVASPGSPAAASAELVPNDTLEGVALVVNAVAAGVTVSEVEAVEPALSVSPEYVATTGYVPASSVDDVAQLVTGSVAAHSVEPPDVKVTVPVAAPGSPLSESDDVLPNEILGGVAAAVKFVGSGDTVNEVVAVDPALRPPPEYVAVIGYVPPGSPVDVVQLVVGSVTAHSVEPPDAKVTVPVAPPGRPDSASIELDPYGTVDGVALAVNDVGTGPTSVRVTELAR